MASLFMRAGRMDLMCVQTRAGFEKILGRKIFTLEQMQAVFHDNREDSRDWRACSMNAKLAMC